MAYFINVGFQNVVDRDKIVSVVSTEAAPIRRMIQTARDEGRAVDATCGRKTKAALVMESGHIVLSALSTETITARCQQQPGDTPGGKGLSGPEKQMREDD